MDELLRQRSPNNSWRVKVYLLNLSGNWDDCGTGILEMTNEIENGEEIEYFKVISTEEDQKNIMINVPYEKLNKLKAKEINSRCILYLPILKRNQFEKQGESIITWTDKEMNEEIALSFLDIIAANETWRNICKRIGLNPNESKKIMFKDLDKLLMPNIENLDKLRYDMENKKEWMIAAIQKNPIFLDELRKIFDELEDLESREYLMKIYELIRSMVFTDDISFLELLLSNEYYLLIFGAFEYSPESMMGKKAEYRKFLTENCTFKKVFDINNESILQKIHLNYRIQYLRDCVISSIIDDQLQNHFQMMIYYNNYEIFQHIINNPIYFKDLFTNFFVNLKDSIGFLNELIQIVKNILQVEVKIALFDKWLEYGIYDIIGKSLLLLDNNNNNNDHENLSEQLRTSLKIYLIEILTFLTQIKINPLISYLKSTNNNPLFEGLLKNLIYGDQGLQIQITELIKYLLDTIHEKRNDIANFFYENFFPLLINHVNQLLQNNTYYNFIHQFVDIMVYCIKYHQCKIRRFIIHNKLLNTLYNVFKLGEKSTSLAIIKVIKAIIINKDDFLYKYIVNYNLLDDIFQLYLQHANKTNLINSACLELFEIIRKNNIKILMDYIVEHFKDKIIQNNLTKFFEKILTKHDPKNEGLTFPEEHTNPDHYEPNYISSYNGANFFDNYEKSTLIKRTPLEEDEQDLASDDKLEDLKGIHNQNIEEDDNKNNGNKENKDDGLVLCENELILQTIDVGYPIEDRLYIKRIGTITNTNKKANPIFQQSEERIQGLHNSNDDEEFDNDNDHPYTIERSLNTANPLNKEVNLHTSEDIKNKGGNNGNSMMKKRTIKSLGKLEKDEEPEIVKKIKLV